MSPMRILLLAICIVFLIVIFRLVSQKRLSMKYSLLWIGLGLAMLICSIFPQIVYALSGLIGFDAPSNFIFLLAIFFLLAIALSLTIIVSRQQRRITTLIQQLAIERFERHHGDAQALEELNAEDQEA